jgi:hypothetical protein
MANDFIGIGIVQTFLPGIVRDNVDVVNFLLLLSYILFFVNWLATTDWVEKVSQRICKPFFDFRLLYVNPHLCRLLTRE